MELFLLKDGSILINEIAPRPHNSGHYTIDGCFTSQFEQLIRAVLGWPLGNTSLMVNDSFSKTSMDASLFTEVGSAVMLNLLGEEDGRKGLMHAQSIVQKALQVPGARVHWYDKSHVSKNRKVFRKDDPMTAF